MNGHSPIETAARLLVPAVIATHVFTVVVGEIGQNTSPDGETDLLMLSIIESFAEASTTVAGWLWSGLVGLAKLWLACVVICAVVYGVPILIKGAKSAQRFSWDTFGTGLRTVEHEPVTDPENRCVNCYAEIDDGQKNIATENTVACGFVLSETERVETFECSECAAADWFEYAMRADEHEEALFTADGEGRETDVESEEEAGSVECPACRTTCKNVHGLRVHWGRTHQELDRTDFPHAFERATGGDR